MVTFRDPVRAVLRAWGKLWGDVPVVVEYDPSLRRRLFWGGWGVTIFPDDGSTPVVRLSTELRVRHVPEILAHELAHVVAGPEAGHGRLWEAAFEDLRREYLRILDLEEVGL